MKRLIKCIVPLLLTLTILVSVGWYFIEYDPALTQELLLQQARFLESSGNLRASIWFYELAYRQSKQDDQVAIELSRQFMAIGNYTKAEHTLSHAIADGGTTELYQALCRVYVTQNKLMDAVRLLDSVKDEAIVRELNALRPQAPVASLPSGFYSEYLTLELDSGGDALYVSLKNPFPSMETDAYTGPISLSGGDTTVYAITVSPQGLVSQPAAYHYSIGNVIEEVTFRDPAVEAAIRKALGIIGDRTIYSNELWNMTVFTLPETADSCQDLRWLPGLKTLIVENAVADDWDVLSSLQELDTLVVRNSVLPASQLDTIASLPKLTRLTLHQCGLSSIEALEQARQLMYLDLSGNTIRDLSPISQLTSLQELYLGSNAVVSMEALTALHELKKLDLSHNSLASLEALESLPGITHLNISGNGLMNLEGIQALAGLVELKAAENALVDIAPLESCRKLAYLDISNNTILNITIITKLVKLEYLDFSHNLVKNLPAFDARCPLETINGGYNQLSSLANLKTLTKLKFVYMDYNAGVKSVDVLTACKALQIVHVYGTAVKNVEKLTAMGVTVSYNPL